MPLKPPGAPPSIRDAARGLQVDSGGRAAVGRIVQGVAAAAAVQKDRNAPHRAELESVRGSPAPEDAHVGKGDAVHRARAGPGDFPGIVQVRPNERVGATAAADAQQRGGRHKRKRVPPIAAQDGQVVDLASGVVDLRWGQAGDRAVVHRHCAAGGVAGVVQDDIDLVHAAADGERPL